MELLQLRYFYESAKNENFSKTAEIFMVPTTSVSASIRRLEEELGCKLFDRSANKIKLNENGQKFQQSLCGIFNSLDNVVENLTAHVEDKRQIKILVKGMRRKITDLIIEYSKENKNTSFKTTFDFNCDNFSDFDIIIDEENNSYTDFERIELFTMNLKLKCAKDDPFNNKKLYLNQLCHRPFVLMDTNSNMQKILTKACNRVGFTPDISILCNDIECYDKFIENGLGIGIGQQNSKNEDIIDLDVTDFKEHYTVYAYYSKKEYYGKAKDFVEFLKSKEI